MKKFILALLLLTLTMSTLMAAVSAAPGPITVYSSVDEENAKKILDAFTKSTGIPYKMVFLSSGPAIARIEAEKDNPQATCGWELPAKTM